MNLNNRLPCWFKQELPGEETSMARHVFSEFGVHTVCQEAECPNIASCFKKKNYTFMLLGNTCTRNCKFCAVDKSGATVLTFDRDEPCRISRLVSLLKLNYAVITSVSRDDLADGGASIFAQTIKLIRGLPEVKTEVLIPDFQGKVKSLKSVVNARPDVIAHNIETVKRLYPELRPRASYGLSMEILHKIKELNPLIITKSSLMLGLGEREEEVVDTMQDLKTSRCDILILGQYLAPSIQHYPVKEFISLEKFRGYKDIGTDLGFKAVLSGPKARSSYQAQDLYYEFNYA